MTEGPPRTHKFRVLLVPTAFGAPQHGTDKGPEHIATTLRLHESPHINAVGPLAIPSLSDVRKSRDENVKDLDSVRAVCQHLRAAVRDLVKEGETPIVLHGDDSSVMGTGFGVSAAGYRDFGIVYFDAHGDLNTPETSPSGCLYGMGVAHLLGYGCSSLLELNDQLPAIQPQNLCLIGTRDLDPGEVQFIEEHQIAKVTVGDVRRGLLPALEAIASKFRNQRVTGLYLHFDQDVVDPIESGATLCRTKGGLHVNELWEATRYFAENFDLLAVSFGNYFPELDGQQKTLGVIEGALRNLGAL